MTEYVPGRQHCHCVKWRLLQKHVLLLTEPGCFLQLLNDSHGCPLIVILYPQ